MRIATLGCAALLAAGLAGRPALAAPGVTGDYVEARSCNIYVGACHAEGERETIGRQAVLAWNFRGGSYEGVNLAGVKAIAVLTGDRNLAQKGAEIQSVLYVDGGADCCAPDAVAKLLRERAGAALGKMVAVKCAPIRFEEKNGVYQVAAEGIATVKVKKQTEQLCCLQKYEVWYKPFMALKESKVGFGVLAEFKEPALKASWAGSDQNNAYFGTFSF